MCSHRRRNPQKGRAPLKNQTAEIKAQPLHSGKRRIPVMACLLLGTFVLSCTCGSVRLSFTQLIDGVLWRDGAGKWFHGKRINNPNTHGTGCTLSSAIASNPAKGFDLGESVKRAKDYISGALAANML